VVQRTRDNAIGVRRLGFGVSGPHGTPLVHPGATADMIYRAFDRGVRLFDTGPSYGAGEAERRLGEAMRRLPRLECIISTKAGITSSGIARRIRDFSPRGIRYSVEGSLRRLGMKRIDWLFLHGPAPTDITDELLKALGDMKKRGEVAMVGVAGRGQELDVALGSGQFNLFMLPVNAALQPYELERIRKLRASGAEIVGVETLAPSLPRFPAPVTAGATWRLARSLRRPFSAAAATPMTPEECLLWALGEGGAHRVVTTTTRPEHLEANIYAVTTPSTGRLIAGPSGLS
jgi:aryl-alcohol dehydrogenase-like predicted oxidoreductase